MNYATIKNCDIANGPGVRVSLFVSGCTHRCPGCFNEEAWDFSYGTPFTQATIDHIVELLRPAHIKGLTLLGGEPFEPQNQPDILKLIVFLPTLARNTSSEKKVSYWVIDELLGLRIEFQTCIKLLGYHSETEDLAERTCDTER